VTCYQGRQHARVFRLFDTRTAGHRPLTTGPSGALHKVLLKWITYYASGVYSEHVRVVRIHPRYRGTSPRYSGAARFRDRRQGVSFIFIRNREVLVSDKSDWSRSLPRPHVATQQDVGSSHAPCLWRFTRTML